MGACAATAPYRPACDIVTGRTVDAMGSGLWSACRDREGVLLGYLPSAKEKLYAETLLSDVNQRIFPNSIEKNVYHSICLEMFYIMWIYQLHILNQIWDITIWNCDAFWSNLSMQSFFFNSVNHIPMKKPDLQDNYLIPTHHYTYIVFFYLHVDALLRFLTNFSVFQASNLPVKKTVYCHRIIG